jgi:hypothetical protein
MKCSLPVLDLCIVILGKDLCTNGFACDSSDYSGDTINRANNQAGLSENRGIFSSGIRLRRILSSVSDSEPMAKRILLSTMPRFHVLVSPRRKLLVCQFCWKEVSPLAGILLHRSHIPLQKWLWAAYLMATVTPEICALQLQRQLGLVMSYGLVLGAQPYAQRSGERQLDFFFRNGGSR